MFFSFFYFLTIFTFQILWLMYSIWKKNVSIYWLLWSGLQFSNTCPVGFTLYPCMQLSDLNIILFTLFDFASRLLRELRLNNIIEIMKIKLIFILKISFKPTCFVILYELKWLNYKIRHLRPSTTLSQFKLKFLFSFSFCIWLRCQLKIDATQMHEHRRMTGWVSNMQTFMF